MLKFAAATLQQGIRRFLPQKCFNSADRYAAAMKHPAQRTRHDDEE
jgi:hypothetical protein